MHPEAVLLDAMMPNLDGFEVCARLKGDPAHREIPVLMVTALDDVPGRLKALEAGADDYVTKPFRARDVLARLDRAAAFRAARARLAADADDPAIPPAVGDYADLKRDLTLEVARAGRYGRPLACVAAVPLGATPPGQTPARWLGECAEQVRHALRDADRVYLLGREEIIVLLPETPREGVAAAVDRVRRGLGPVAAAFGVGGTAWADGRGVGLLAAARELALAGSPEQVA